MVEPGPRLRIGELSRRVGLSDHVLRAWETRYSLFRPTRSPGGFRLYSRDDERRARRMVSLLSEGMSAAEAAADILDSEGLGSALPVRDTAAGSASPISSAESVSVPAQSSATSRTFSAVSALLKALEGFDEAAAQAILDRLLAEQSVVSAINDVILPSLAELGRHWEVGEVSVAQEHYASNVIRGRLLGLARGWGIGHGPRAILACAPGEHHDLALLSFGIILHQYGWRISFLGADTPFPAVALAADSLPRSAVVISATVADSSAWPLADLAALAHRTRLFLAGPAVYPETARAIGATHLRGDPVTAAGLMDQRLVAGGWDAEGQQAARDGTLSGPAV